jgi:hypothetical protein
MAKGTLLNYSNLRGSIGGVTYSQNASGAYARVRKSPINRNTQGQQTARNNFASISGAFRLLTLAERQTYEDMRDFYTTKDGIGNTVRPTASQLFARINGKLLQNGVINTTDLIKICPAPVEVENTNFLGALYNTTTNVLSVTALFANQDNDVPADSILVISATPAISNGISRVPDGTFKKLVVFPSGTAIDGTDITAEYDAVFTNSWNSGASWIQVVLSSTITGQVSNYMRVKVEVV